jgi:hypothetical protein
VILHTVGLAVAIRGEGESQRQDLTIDGQAPAAGLADGVEALFGRDVHEVGAGPGASSEPYHVLEGQLFDQLGVDEMYVPPVPLVALLRQEIVVHD